MKFRSVSTNLRVEPLSVKIQSYGLAESRSWEENMLQQRIFYTNENLKNYCFIDTGTSIPINTCKFTKNRLHIVSGTSIPRCSSYSENDQRL